VSLWRAAPSHQSIIRALRESPDFWKQLTETLSVSIERHLHAYNARQAALNPTKAAKSPSGSEKGKERLTEDLDDEPGESHIRSFPHQLAFEWLTDGVLLQ